MLLDLTPKIDLTTKMNAALRSARLSLKDTATMSDRDLLGIAGIGRRTLRQIRRLQPSTLPKQEFGLHLVEAAERRSDIDVGVAYFLCGMYSRLERLEAKVVDRLECLEAQVKELKKRGQGRSNS